MRRHNLHKYLVFFLMLGFLSGTMLMTSCSDDDDDDTEPQENNENENDDDNNENNLEGSGFELDITGVINEEIKGNRAWFYDSAVAYSGLLNESHVAKSIYMSDSNGGNEITVVFADDSSDQISEGSYELSASNHVSSGSKCLVTLIKGASQTFTPTLSPSGSMTISTINENEIKGQFDNIVLKDPSTGPDNLDSITIKGSFEAEPFQ